MDLDSKWHIWFGIWLCWLTFKTGTAYAQQCPDNFTDYIPIADLGKGTFKGSVGGLYPDGSNVIPAAHLKEGIRQSSLIAPRNKNGEIDSADGEIVFLVLGYSTAAMTGRFFRDMIAQQEESTPLKVVVGAQGGKDINYMMDTTSSYWPGVDSALLENNVSEQQVGYIWLSSGDIEVSENPFPTPAVIPMVKYLFTLEHIKKQFPNAIVFLSDRPYAGYIDPNNDGLNYLAEPTAYYNSWTIKWLIENQIKNKKGFDYAALPFIDWGPTLWTDGTKGDASGYTWDCTDAGKGGIHASSKGRMKEAAKLYLFFSSHPYIQQWMPH